MSENERRLISENEALKAEAERLLTRVSDLKARLNRNWGNNSKPPNSDMGRKRGGLPGHERKTHELGGIGFL